MLRKIRIVLAAVFFVGLALLLLATICFVASICYRIVHRRYLEMQHLSLGVIIGAIWGYSKKFDMFMMTIHNIIANVPYILLITVMVYIIGSGFWSFVFALTITGWLAIAYFFRTQVMIIRDREYSLASRCLGTPVNRVIGKNILPFLTSVIVTLLDAAPEDAPYHTPDVLDLKTPCFDLEGYHLQVTDISGEKQTRWIRWREKTGK